MKYKNKSVGIGEKMFEKKEMDLPSSKTLTVVAEGVIIEGKLYSRGATGSMEE